MIPDCAKQGTGCAAQASCPFHHACKAACEPGLGLRAICVFVLQFHAPAVRFMMAPRKRLGPAAGKMHRQAASDTCGDLKNSDKGVKKQSHWADLTAGRSEKQRESQTAPLRALAGAFAIKWHQRGITAFMIMCAGFFFRDRNVYP